MEKQAKSKEAHFQFYIKKKKRRMKIKNYLHRA